jgi:hypothetical protein
MKKELILIAIIAMVTSLSAYAQDAAEDGNAPASRQMQAPELSQVGFQQGLCTIGQRKI